MDTPSKKQRWAIAICIALFGAFTVWAAAPSTEAVISLATGLKVGGKATDRIGFYNATPTPKPVVVRGATAEQVAIALAAEGLLATATPTAP